MQHLAHEISDIIKSDERNFVNDYCERNNMRLFISKHLDKRGRHELYKCDRCPKIFYSRNRKQRVAKCEHCSGYDKYCIDCRYICIKCDKDICLYHKSYRDNYCFKCDEKYCTICDKDVIKETEYCEKCNRKTCTHCDNKGLHDCVIEQKIEEYKEFLKNCGDKIKPYLEPELESKI